MWSRSPKCRGPNGSSGRAWCRGHQCPFAYESHAGSGKGADPRVRPHASERGVGAVAGVFPGKPLGARGVWKTPKPRAGSRTPLLSSRVGVVAGVMSEVSFLSYRVVSRPSRLRGRPDEDLVQRHAARSPEGEGDDLGDVLGAYRGRLVHLLDGRPGLAVGDVLREFRCRPRRARSRARGRRAEALGAATLTSRSCPHLVAA